MRIRYNVEIVDFLDHDARRERPVAFRRGLTLGAAWRCVERAERRGLRLFGGAISRANWGGRGGRFPQCYRSATIRAEIS